MFSDLDIALACAPLYLTDSSRSYTSLFADGLRAMDPPFEDRHFWELRRVKSDWRTENRTKRLARLKRWRDKNKHKRDFKKEYWARKARQLLST